jgi:hypothetical protein
VGPVIWEKQIAVVKANNIVKKRFFMMNLDLTINEIIIDSMAG